MSFRPNGTIGDETRSGHSHECKDMQLKINYDAEKNILYGSYKGAFTVQQFEKQLREIVSTAEFPPDVPTIWDLSETDVSQFDWNFIQQLLEIRERFPARGDALIAIVAPSDLTFGVSRMYTARGETLPQQMQVFRTVTEAEAWLKSALD